MTLKDDRQLDNTERKLSMLEKWIAEAKAAPASPENSESVRSLVQMANQLREEIVRYKSRSRLRAS